MISGLLFGLAALAAPPKPHLVFLLIDDLGFNDIGFNQNAKTSANPSGDNTTSQFIPSPTIDSLAKDGLILGQLYTQSVCSPTRASLMTGRYPSHTGMGPDCCPGDYGVPPNETLLSSLLKDAGYSTHVIGKWHLGLCNKLYWPTFRDFDTYFGYLNGGQDYYTHYSHGIGFDFHNSTAQKMGFDAKDWAGNYSTYAFTVQHRHIISQHDPDVPFFLYYPLQSVHSPLEAPEEFKNPFSSWDNKDRSTKAGMVGALDAVVKDLLISLKGNSMYDDTLIIFSADNGGELSSAGNNYPLRGGKHASWEGGIRVSGFIKGTNSDLAKIPSGYSNVLIHITDWLPTIVGGIAGVSKFSTQQPLDGFNQWDAILGKGPDLRNATVFNMPGAGQGLKFGAVRLGPYKLLINAASTGEDDGGNQAGYEHVQHLNKQVPPPGFETPPLVVPKPVDYPGSNGIFVFDVVNDPTESTNLAYNKTLVAELIDFFTTFQKTAIQDRKITIGGNGHFPPPYSAKECPFV